MLLLVDPIESYEVSVFSRENQGIPLKFASCTFVSSI
jgi:hypothetical protein